MRGSKLNPPSEEQSQASRASRAHRRSRRIQKSKKSKKSKHKGSTNAANSRVSRKHKKSCSVLKKKDPRLGTQTTALRRRSPSPPLKKPSHHDRKPSRKSTAAPVQPEIAPGREGSWNSGIPEKGKFIPFVRQRFSLPADVVILMRPGESMRNSNHELMYKMKTGQKSMNCNIKDMNQPFFLPHRPNPKEYIYDPPLSEMGHL